MAHLLLAPDGLATSAIASCEVTTLAHELHRHAHHEQAHHVSLLDDKPRIIFVVTKQTTNVLH